MYKCRIALWAIILAAILSSPVTAQSCQLCTRQDSDRTNAQDSSQNETPLTIDITTNLDFSRAALTGKGGGEIVVDPQNGSRMEGGIVALGGYAAAGTVMLNGAPGRSIRIDMPSSIRMTSAAGGVIEIINFRTNLGPAPHLDMTGQLIFSFGGDLVVTGDINGKFRGRIPITAQYE